MEFKIPKSELLRGLKLASAVASKEKTVPIIGNVLLRATGKTALTIAATDLNVSLTAELKSTNASEGGITIGARAIVDAVSSAPGDTIAFKLSDGWCEIKSGKAKYKLPGLADRDFPKIPAIGEGKLHKLAAPVLASLIDRVLFAASTEDGRFEINGCRFSCDGKLATMAATDGKRISVAQVECKAKIDMCTWHRKGVGEARKLLGEGDIKIGVVDRSIFVVSDGITLSSKLIDLDFPKYEAALMTGQPHVATVDRVALLESIKRVQQIENEHDALKFDFTREALALTGEHKDRGRIEDEVTCEYVGDPIAIGLNPKFVIDSIETMESEQVVISIASELDPVMVRPLGGSGHTCVVMPVRLG